MHEEPESRLETPAGSRHGSVSGRNLVLGVLVLLSALALLVLAISLIGPKAAIPLAAALLTVVTLFVLGRAQILRQRNGGFVALAVVCLIAVLVSFAEYGGARLTGHLNGKQSQPAGDEQAQSTAARDELPLLTEVFNLLPAEVNARRFKVLQDVRVPMNGKAYLIKSGEIFPVSEVTDRDVRFNLGNQQVLVPLKFAEMIQPDAYAAEGTAGFPGADPATDANSTQASVPPQSTPAPGTTPPLDEMLPHEETPSRITQKAQLEAIRRFPALGQKDSPENRLFVETYQELKHSGAEDFFADPQWPLQLAELLAKRENWERQQ